MKNVSLRSGRQRFLPDRAPSQTMCSAGRIRRFLPAASNAGAARRRWRHHRFARRPPACRITPDVCAPSENPTDRCDLQTRRFEHRLQPVMVGPSPNALEIPASAPPNRQNMAPVSDELKAPVPLGSSRFSGAALARSCLTVDRHNHAARGSMLGAFAITSSSCFAPLRFWGGVCGGGVLAHAWSPEQQDCNDDGPAGAGKISAAKALGAATGLCVPRRRRPCPAVALAGIREGVRLDEPCRFGSRCSNSLRRDAQRIEWFSTARGNVSALIRTPRFRRAPRGGRPAPSCARVWRRLQRRIAARPNIVCGSLPPPHPPPAHPPPQPPPPPPRGSGTRCLSLTQA